MEANPGGKRQCCLCDDPAVAVFYMPGGCIARPDLLEQPLCMHHVVRSQPLGGMLLSEDLTKGAKFTEWWDSPYCNR